jgi:hypothetical protein
MAKSITFPTRFGSLIAVSEADPRHYRGSGGTLRIKRRLVVQCDCGSPSYHVALSHLIDGSIWRCRKCINAAIGKSNESHGMSKSKEYLTWAHMIKRCTCKKDKSYNRYGGRGIKVCDRWLHSFENFYADMGPRPGNMTIERINSNGDYSLNNCRWATRAEQSRNRRTNIMITINGETRCATDWAIRFGITGKLATGRIRKGWDPVKAVTTPVKSPPPKKPFTH